MRGVKTLICMMVLWMGVAIATPPYMPPLYEVQVTIDGTPRVGETYTLRFEVRSLIKDVSTHVFVYIPPQIEILEGITTWDGYLEAGTTLSFSLTLRGLEKGTYNIYAQVWTDHEEEENLTYRIQNLYVVSTDTSGTWGTSSTFYREHFLPFLESQATRDTGEYGIQQHQITVQGQVRYFNKDVGVNSYEAFPGAIVRLLDVSGSVIAEALTDANGNYSMSASVYSGNYMIKVWARNSAVRMTNADYFEPVHWITVVSDHTYYVDIDVDISQAEWARILQNIKKGYDFTEEKFNWTRNYQIEVEYHNEQGTSYFWYWSVWPAHDEKIHVYQNDVWDNPPDYYWGRYVCTHEYGHAVMFEYFDWSMPEGDGPDPHIYCSVSSPGFAMSEGWAEFFGNAVLEWQGIYSFFGEPEEYYAYCGYPYWQGCDFTNEDGTIVEGAVMQVLWDIYDKTTTNDGTVGFDDEGPDQDQLNFVNYLWNSLRFSYSITEFLSKWLQSGYPDISEIFDINIFGIKPPAPTNLTSNLQDESSVNLEWELNSIWEGQVYVYSRQEGGDYEIITSLPPNTSSLQCNLPVMGTYYFRVSSLTCDTPALSNETMVVTNFLNPPTNFTAISTYPWNYVELSWEDNSNYEDGYEIKRRTPGGNWVVLDTTGANETSFIDTMVSLFNEYAYKVRAIAPGASSSSIFTWAYDGPLTCSDGTAYSNSKKILISNGKVHMIYRNEALRVRYLSYSLYSGNLLEEVDLSSAAAGYYPLIIGKGGKLVAFWNGTYEDGDNRTEVYIASSIDNGESWSGPYECLESAPGDVIFLNLSATFDRTSDTVYLAVIDYYGHGGGSFYVFCVKLIDFDGYGDWMVDEIDTIGYFDGAMLSEIDGLTIGFDKVSSFPLIVLCLRDSLYYWGAGPPHENSFSSGFLCEGSSPSLDGRVLVYQDGDDIYLRVYNSGGMPAWSSAQYIGTGEAPSMTYYRGKAYVFYESDGLYLSYGVPNSVNWSEVLLEGDGNYISGAVVREYLLVDTAIIEGIGGSLGDSIYQVRGTNMKVFYLYTRLLMSGYGIGFGIRDIGSVGLTGGPQGLGEELIYAVYPASPNPFRDKMEVRFIIPEVSIVRFTIYDVTGRRVRTTVREFERGVHRVVWNGEDSMGRRVSPGIYFYRVEMDGIKGGGKVIYLR